MAESASVVFMPVGDQDGAHPVRVFQQIGNVWDDEVYSQQVLSGKLDSAVNDDNVVTALQGHHIFTDFPQTAQGYNTQIKVRSRI